MTNRHTVAQKEISKHFLTLVQALYQLCVDCARLFVMGGKLLFDSLDELMNPVQEKAKTNFPSRKRHQ
jgi:hypothetical protein